MTTLTKIEELLEGRLHEKDLSEIANLAEDNANGLIDTLLQHVYEESDDPSVKKASDNATWALQHLHPKDRTTFVYPYKDQLIQLAINTQSPSKQRMVLALLRETEFEKADLQTDFIDFCLATMVSCEHAVGIRSLCIHLAFKQCRHYPELAQELKQQLELMEDGLLQPGLRNAKMNTLKLIKKLHYEDEKELD
ncbi:MAG: hypothetical protein II623_05785 [Paludibacteraceae bacterium]|nr:hypothetical protein [Paludibacteraceae bacterium]MBR6041534.1 hypothetical protein [Paludibacteraceae bacterium]